MGALLRLFAADGLAAAAVGLAEAAAAAEPAGAAAAAGLTGGVPAAASACSQRQDTTRQ